MFWKNLRCRLGLHKLTSYARVHIGNLYIHSASCYESDVCRGRIHYYSEPDTPRTR